MNTKKFEEQLWQQIESTIENIDEVDIFEMLSRLDSDNLIEQFEHDDHILFLSGLDESALERIQQRRRYLENIKDIVEESDRRRKKALKNWRSRHKRGAK